jgi:uncharacterized protein YndB with AHSA1/START domain
MLSSAVLRLSSFDKGGIVNRIEQTYIIAASPEEVWRALTDPELIPQWSGAPATFAPEPETEYSLWGGDVGGRIVEVIPLERLVQTWKPSDWTIEDSIVTFTLTPSEGGTRVDLIHENVEESDYEGTSQGWDTYYLGAIKRMLEQPKPEKKALTRKSAAKKKAPAQKKSAKKAAAKKTAAKRGAAKKKSATKKRAGKK